MIILTLIDTAKLTFNTDIPIYTSTCSVEGIPFPIFAIVDLLHLYDEHKILSYLITIFAIVNEFYNLYFLRVQRCCTEYI